MDDVDWTWTAWKSERNRAKHKVSFELAVHVFDDPLHLTVEDPFEEEERWRTYGQIQNVLILVVHTEPVSSGDGRKVGRIISARKATANERRIVEEAIYDSKR